MFLIILFTVVAGFFALDFYLKNVYRVGKYLNKIPGPKELPIVGSLFLHMRQSRVELFYQDREWNNKYKNVHRFTLGPYGTVVINHPDDIETILSSVKYIKKDRMYEFFHPWLGDGLLMSDGAKWQKRRKLLTPAFHFSILKDACKIFQEQSFAFVEYLKQKVGVEVDILVPVTEYVLHSITESTMGRKFEEGTKKFTDYKKNVLDMGEYFIHRVIRIYLYSDFIFNLSPVGKLQNKAIEELHSFTENVINERRDIGQSIEIEENNLKIDDNIRGSKRLAMLDLMLAVEKKGEIDKAGIQEEVDTFMFEGHDTTSSGITFLLMNIANYPDVQERIVEELRGIFYNPDDKASMEDMNKMTYLEMCVKETLRLYPSVHTISRKLTEDVQLKDYFIPKGAGVSIMPFDVHRNADFFPDPLKFDPERFSAENSVGRHPFTYIPFSAGPRNCIGQKFAVLEMKSVVATILRKYVLLPVTKPKDIIFILDIVLKSRDPIKIKFSPREDAF